jgi:hypothetical protein
LSEAIAGKIIYLVGAGRSGTTILAAMLGENEKIDWRGEFIHLADWANRGNICSCGRALIDCDYWKSRDIAEVLGPAAKISSEYEQHNHVLAALMNDEHFSDGYRNQQAAVVGILGSPDRWLLDSSKYVGRALGLASCNRLDVKFIYMVRDPRGVVYSFGKKVQTRRGTLRACAYYLLVNTAAQLAIAMRLKGRCLKVRYEDLVIDPVRELERIGKFLGMDLSAVGRKAQAGGGFSAEHIAGGNRWAKSGPASLSPDTEWREQMGWGKRLIVYLLCLPFQIVNHYGI